MHGSPESLQPLWPGRALAVRLHPLAKRSPTSVSLASLPIVKMKFSEKWKPNRGSLICEISALSRGKESSRAGLMRLQREDIED